MNHFSNCLLSTALAALLVMAGCKKAATAPSTPPPRVTVSRPVLQQVTDWDEYTGHLQAPETATVQARVSGFIEQTPFKEGTLVKKGEVLFIIDNRQFKADLENKQAAVEKDSAQVDLSKSLLARSADLLKKRAIAQQDYDTQQAGYNQALSQLAADKAAAENARLNLQWTQVAAPIDGRIGRIMVTVGNLINGGAGQATILTSIVSVDPIYCYTPIPERAFLKYSDYAKRATSMSVREAKIPCSIKLETEKAFTREGVIDFIDNQLDPNTGTIEVRGVIPNPQGELTPGLFAQMRLTGTGPYEALLVPDKAIGTEQSERYVLVVGTDGVVATRTVKLGRLFGTLRVITDGLAAGESVVVDGLQIARPGSKVAATEQPIATPAPGAQP